MVDPDPQAVVDVMRVGERLGLIDHIETPVKKSRTADIGEQKSLVRSRAGDLQAGPPIANMLELGPRMGRWI